MNARERVRTALAHRQPDRIPIDFGGTFITGMHCSTVAAMRDYYGLPKQPVKVHEPYQMLGWIDNDLSRAMGLDVIGVLPPNTIFGFPLGQWKEYRTPWGQEVLVPVGFRTTSTDQGDVLIYPQGDTSAPPSGHMPKGGYFFDTIVRQNPIDEDRLDPADNLEEFGPISKNDLAFIANQVKELGDDPRARILALPGTGLGDIALVPAPFLTHPRGIRDIAEWYMSTASRQDYVKAIFAKQVDIALGNMQRIADAVGDAIDVVVVCGTDFGTQASQFCSSGTFRELWLPHYRKMNDWIHTHTSWKTFKHSCGAVEPLIEDFLDAGFDVLNPVQCSATGMDPHLLKEKYGQRLVFWGGGVDTQKTLPFGTPEQVRAQVLQRCEVFGKNGGFVFNAIHNVQALTPTANIVAMLEALAQFNGLTTTCA